jgi:succinyl-diaminopimelate desuccinylase
MAVDPEHSLGDDHECLKRKKGRGPMQDKQFASYLDSWLPEHEEEIVQSLIDLLGINSVGAKGSPGKPFGQEVDRALNWFVDKAQGFGMKTRNVEGYAAHAEIGAGQEMAMALTHIDIVPAGSGWSRNPFGEMFGDQIYGRGSQDNKGPTVACLYALRAIKESGAPLKRRIRHVVGGNEESGFRCVQHYFEVEEKPTYGFSPDAAFPLVFAEKGSMNIQVEFDLPDVTTATADCHLVDLYGGERPNIVAAKATAVLKVPQSHEDEIIAMLEEQVEGARQSVGGPGLLEFAFTKEPGCLVVTASGKAAHAADPDQGTNALTALCFVLGRMGPRLAVSDALRFAGEAGHIHGKGLCLESQDDISGRLTCNLGTATVDAKGDAKTVRAIYNIRYPVKVSGEELKRRAENCPRPDYVRLTVLSVGKPHYTDPDSFLVKSLLKIYREETGDLSSPPIAIGGGTYAKVIPGGVAFGPSKPGAPELAHQADERIALDDLLQLVRIYARALFALAT